LAKPNYSFEKRQRELARKKKQEVKRQKKAADRADRSPAPADTPDTEAQTTAEAVPSPTR